MRKYLPITLVFLTLVACSSRRIVVNGSVPDGTEVLSTVAQESGACLEASGGVKLLRVQPTTATVSVNSQVVWQVTVPSSCLGTVQLIRDGAGVQTFVGSAVFTKTYSTAGTFNESIRVSGTANSVAVQTAITVNAVTDPVDPAAPTALSCSRFDFAPSVVSIDVTPSGVILSDAALQLSLTTNIPAQVVSASVFPSGVYFNVLGGSANSNSTQINIDSRIAAPGNVVIGFLIADLANPSNTQYCAQLIPVVPRVISYAAATLNLRVNGEVGVQVAGGPSIVSRANIEDPVTLEWSSANAVSCAIEGAGSLITGLSGTAVVPGSIAGAESTFALVCRDGNGTESRKSITARAVVRSGLALLLDAANPDGLNNRLCTSKSWKDLSVNASAGALSGHGDCGAISGWGGTGSPSDPYRLEFDSRSPNPDFVSVPNSSALQPVAVTACVWVKGRSLNSSTAVGGSDPANQYILFKRNRRTLNFEGFALQKIGSSGYLFQVTDSAAAHLGVVGAGSVDSSKYNYICGSFERPYLKIWVNGTERASSNHDYPLDVFTRPLVVGSSGETNYDTYFDGAISQVQVYNRALSATEIRQNCKAHAHRFAGASCDP